MLAQSVQFAVRQAVLPLCGATCEISTVGVKAPSDDDDDDNR